MAQELTHEEIISWPKELADIFETQGQENRRELLLDLAKKVGASKYRWASIGGQSEANESLLVDNIQRAIQTAAMADMCRTAARHYKITILAASVSVISALAAWMAVLCR